MNVVSESYALTSISIEFNKRNFDCLKIPLISKHKFLENGLVSNSIESYENSFMIQDILMFIAFTKL